MEKKSYLKPELHSESFVSSTYIAACWLANCNIGGKIYHDYNPIGGSKGNEDGYWRTNDDHANSNPRLYKRTNSTEQPEMEYNAWAETMATWECGGHFGGRKHNDNDENCTNKKVTSSTYTQCYNEGVHTTTGPWYRDTKSLS